MGKIKFAPFAFGLATAFVVTTNPLGAYAAPAADTKTEVTYVDLDIQRKIINTAKEEVASPFYQKGISIASDCVMIRKEANVNSEAVGKLYNGAGFDVLDQTGDWIKIKSGNCEGYVNASYVVTGKDAEHVADTTDRIYSYGKMVADGVEIKAQPADTAAAIATVSTEDVVDVVSVIPGSEWMKVSFDGQEGYVKNQSVQVVINCETGITLEEEMQRQAELEAAVAAEKVEETQSTETAASTETTAETSVETEAPATEATEAAVETEAPAVEETTAETEAAPAEETTVEETAEEESSDSTASVYIEERYETVWATDSVNIRESADFNGNKLGVLYQGSSLTRTGVCENGWSRVEYNGGTAYIHSDYLTTTEPVQETTEDTYTETPSTSYDSSLGQQVVDYARQFIGNPYVWGGTSLTNGADCSGFVQSVYRDMGYSLPRTCTPQLNSGMSVSLDDLQPGDLLGYAYGGEIGHIAIYAGNGMIVHASDYSTGIIETSMYYGGTPCRATRIIY